MQSVAQAGSWVCPLPWGLRGTSEKRHLCSPVAADSEVHGARQLTSVHEWESGPGGSQESMSAGAAVSDASVLPDLILLRKIKNPNLYKKSFNF